jgi:hypothetical protein
MAMARRSHRMRAVSLTIVLAGVLRADATEASAQPASVTVMASRIMTHGVVGRIDHAARTLLLNLPNGEQVLLQVSSAVTEFEQLKAGDPVAVDYAETVRLSLEPTLDGATADPGAVHETVRVDVPDGRPSPVISSQEVTAIVESIDRAARTATLRGPSGTTAEFSVAADAAPFDELETGDRVTATFTQSLALQRGQT